jgi:SAM-dependent methyltransferase
VQTNGYVTDIDYPEYFHPQQSPASVSFSCGLVGVEVVPLDREFTFLDLGAGCGTTASVLAAANPHGRFYSADFNPRHAAVAREVATAAGLDNLSVVQCSFADLAEGRVALPQFDFVNLGGVYSWVSREQKQNIRTFLKSSVRDGGLVYVNYNAMPGWAAAVPLQRLILDYSDTVSGTRLNRVLTTRQWLRQLIRCNPDFFAKSELKLPLRLFLDRDPAYAAHEFMDRDWEPLFHTEVSRDFAEAGLEYVASASIGQQLKDSQRPQDHQRLLADLPDPTMRETVRDILDNNEFREDLYVRAPRRHTPTAAAEWLDQAGLCLSGPRRTDELRPITHDTVHALLDSLEKAPLTFAEITELPDFHEMSTRQLTHLASRLIATGWATPYFRCLESNAAEPARRLNRVNAERAQSMRPTDMRCALATPVQGSGIELGVISSLVYLASVDNIPGGAESTVDRVVARLRDTDLPVKVGNGEPRPGGQLTRDEISDKVADISATWLPVWDRLGAR